MGTAKLLLSASYTKNRTGTISPSGSLAASGAAGVSHISHKRHCQFLLALTNVHCTGTERSTGAGGWACWTWAGSHWGFLSHKHETLLGNAAGMPNFPALKAVSVRMTTDTTEARPPAGLKANGNLQQQKDVHKLNNSSQQTPSRGLSQLEHKLIHCSRRNPRGLPQTRENLTALPAALSEPCCPLPVGAAAQLSIFPNLFQSHWGSCLSTGCISLGLCQWLQPQQAPRLKEGTKKA